MSEKINRERKFWLMLPVLIVPIATVFFWMMGGGKGSYSPIAAAKGFNTQLPNAKAPVDSTADKLRFYMMAEADSSKRVDQIRLDPYRRDSAVTKGRSQSPAYTFDEPDHYQTHIASIRKKVSKSLDEEVTDQPVSVVKNHPYTPDPEMEAINGTLDKLMAIQNPQMPMQKIVAHENVYEVGIGDSEDSSYFGRRRTRDNKPSFHRESSQGRQDAINALIPAEQVLSSGAIVKLELSVPITINQITVPAGVNVFGTAALEGERLVVHITSVRYKDKILPVALTVYDLDGLEGIYVPGSIGRDVAKSSADNAIQATGIQSFDPSVKTQIAAAGIGAAKSMLSKKVKQQYVTLTAGYRVLLYDAKQMNR